MENKNPGLHKIGPAPYDYVYNPAKGQKVSFVGIDGHVYTGTVTNVGENEETGEIKVTVQQFDDGLGFTAIEDDAPDQG